MKKYKIAIVGGGFSALVLVSALKYNNVNEYIICEKLDRVGKKILSTGNGKGNLTNKHLSVEFYHGENVDFCGYAINRYDNLACQSFFSELGLMFAAEGGKVYPAGFQANSILDVLRYTVENRGVQLALCCQVQLITKNKECFLLKTTSGDIYAEKIVFAFGGCSQKQFGTDGSAFELAKMLGHSITPLSPSLVQMRSSSQIIKGLKGIRSEVKLSLFDSDKQIKSVYGDILFTDAGISGNAVFNLSSYLAGLQSPVIKIEFMPEISINRLIEYLLYKKSKFLKMPLIDFLNGIVHKQVGKNIIKSLTVKQNVSQLTHIDIIKIADIIKSMPVEVSGTLGFDYSQVTHGGIKTCEVDNITFESKLVKGLYMIGECLDIDGDCGGYNLQWAFSSAMCCAEGLNAAIK